MISIAIILFAVVSFVMFVWVGIYFLSQMNIFFSPVLKGEIKVATWQNLPRKFFGRLTSGSYVDAFGVIQNGDRYIDSKTGKIIPGVKPKSILEKLFGVTWIGLPPYGRVHSWKLSYSKWENQESGADKLVVVKDKVVSTLHVRPTFAFVVDEAETADKVPLTIKGKYTLSLVCAMTAIFSNKNWIANIESAIVATIVDYLKTLTFDIFMGKKIELGNDFIPQIMSINVDGRGNQSIGRYGFMLEDINILSVEIGGVGKDEITKATTALKVAKETAKATIEAAEAKAKAIVKQARGIKSLRLALGDNANQIGLLQLAEAIKEHKGTLALGGNVMSAINLGEETQEKGTS